MPNWEFRSDSSWPMSVGPIFNESFGGFEAGSGSLSTLAFPAERSSRLLWLREDLGRIRGLLRLLCALYLRLQRFKALRLCDGFMSAMSLRLPQKRSQLYSVLPRGEEQQQERGCC